MKTPKEKAEELVEIFASFDDNFNSFRYDVKCALICVDEMYDIASQNDNVIQMNYLTDVKKELESL